MEHDKGLHSLGQKLQGEEIFKERFSGRNSAPGKRTPKLCGGGRGTRSREWSEDMRGDGEELIPQKNKIKEALNT